MQSIDRRITPAYKREQERLHRRGYGEKGDRWVSTVFDLALQHGHSSVLDYGAGAGSLGRALRRLGMACADYDPCVASMAAAPQHARLVVCTDVLEHIEPECIRAVLAHLAELCDGHLFTVISRVDAGKTLSDGRNAHILLRPWEWWEAEMKRARFYPTSDHVVNPNPEKQFACVWRQWNGE